MISGLAGAWLARLGVVALMAMAPADLPRGDEIHVDAVALLFAVLVGLAASTTFGLAPALQTSRVQLSAGLREGGKGTPIGSWGVWVRNALVVAEIALAVVLVAGAGLEPGRAGLRRHGLQTGSAVAIAVAMLLATYIPGRRAVRVDPIAALRAE